MCCSCARLKLAAATSLQSRFRPAHVALLVLSLAAPGGARIAAAGEPALLELTSAGQTFQGRVLHVGQKTCWFLGQDGTLHELPISGLQRPRTVAPRFRRLSTASLRDRLQHEFGREFEIRGTEHYLVCARRGTAADYAEVFEKVYRSFHSYFSTRGFPIERPEFPLVAVVFPDRRSFVDYARRDGVSVSPGLRGYYLNTTNRVAVFDAHSDRQTSGLRLPGTPPATGEAGSMPFAAALSGSADLEATIVHETTHQVAFNTGLHSRIGGNPRWVVEGLATAFESPGIRSGGGRRSEAASRVNRSRSLWFQDYVAHRRKPQFVESLVATDRLYRSATLDFYSQAWALSFFLMETRPQAFNRYLESLGRRDPAASYPAAARLQDFRQAFGNSLDRLETELVRFMARLETR